MSELMLKRLREFLNDPVRMEEAARHIKEKEMRRQRNMERMKKFYQDEESFDRLMERVLQKHGDRWTDLCYRNGFMPHPWNLLYSIFDIAEEEGEEVDPLDPLTESFASVLWKYRGWTFAITHGQGVVTSVYKGSDLVYRD